MSTFCYEEEKRKKKKKVGDKEIKRNKQTCKLGRYLFYKVPPSLIEVVYKCMFYENYSYELIL